MVFIFLCLTYFTQQPGYIHVVAKGKISFLQLNSILLYIYTTSSSIACGHLGCLHTLVIINKTVMNIRLHVYFKLVFLFSLDENPEGGQLDHTVILVLIWESPSIFCSGSITFHFHQQRSMCSVASDSLQLTDCSLPGSSVYGIFPDKITRVGCHTLLQGIFPTQA